MLLQTCSTIIPLGDALKYVLLQYQSKCVFFGSGRDIFKFLDFHINVQSEVYILVVLMWPNLKFETSAVTVTVHNVGVSDDMSVG